MQSLRTGVDLIEIERFESAYRRYGQRLLERLFTPRELAENGESMASLAARFAAKEAVSKAFGTGIGQVTWQEIEIGRGELGEPPEPVPAGEDLLGARVDNHVQHL